MEARSVERPSCPDCVWSCSWWEIWPLWDLFLSAEEAELHLLRCRNLLCDRGPLPGPVLWTEALPGADDLFGSHSSPRGGPGLLVLILGLYGVDTALWRNINFNLEKTVQRERGETHDWSSDSVQFLLFVFTHLAMRLGGAWLGWSGLMGWMRLLVPAAEWHLGDKLANMVVGVQPRFSRRRRDRATRDLDAFPPTVAGAAGFPSPSPSLASTRLSEADVLSKATLMGDGQTGVWSRKGREGEALAEGKSEMPE